MESPSNPNPPSPGTLLAGVTILAWTAIWGAMVIAALVIDGISGNEGGAGFTALALSAPGFMTALLIALAIGFLVAFDVGQSTEIYPWGCPSASCKRQRVKVLKSSRMRWRCDQCRVTWGVGHHHWEDERERQHQTRYEIRRCEKCHEDRALYIARYANADWEEECRACGYRQKHNHFNLI